MSPEHLQSLVEFFARVPKAKARLKVFQGEEPSDWGTWLTIPTKGTIELALYGPVSMQDIEWIEVRLQD